eukprot:gene7838-8035_t
MFEAVGLANSSTSGGSSRGSAVRSFFLLPTPGQQVCTRLPGCFGFVPGDDEYPACYVAAAKDIINAAKDAPADAQVVTLLDDGVGAVVRAAKPGSSWTIKVPHGIQVAVLIVSMWQTNTTWHVEDLFLSSMNYLGLGMPKLWFMAPSEEVARSFKQLLEDVLGGDALQQLANKQCLLHHLDLSKVLDSGMVPFVQQPGDAIFTAPGSSSIHITVSAGFSAAVSSNCYFSSSRSFEEFVSSIKSSDMAFVMDSKQQGNGHQVVHEALSISGGLLPMLKQVAAQRCMSMM